MGHQVYSSTTYHGDGGDISVAQDPAWVRRDTVSLFEAIVERERDVNSGGADLRDHAKRARGVFIDLQLTASTTSAVLDDTEVRHRLGRVPAIIVVQADMDGLDGRVLGSPVGGTGANGANVQRWTTERIYLRATRTGRYQVVVV